MADEETRRSVAAIRPDWERIEAGNAAEALETMERRAVDVSHEERPLILVAVSGGGSRAAALGWVILKEVAKFRYPASSPSRSLVDDIAVVSSVSGGSVIAAGWRRRLRGWWRRSSRTTTPTSSRWPS